MNRIDNVIYEIATDKTFVKAKGNALGIDKLILSFVEFDPRTKKSKNNIDIYLDVAEALAFAQEILSGKIPKLSYQEKKRCIEAKEKYPKAVYFSPLGGVSEENARKRGLRSDGKAISRQFNFGPGEKKDFLFTAIQKPGHTNPTTKLINPESNCKPEILIRVAVCEPRELKKFALMLQVHIQSFYTAKYATGGYDSDYQGNSTSTSVNNGNNQNRQGTSSQTLQQNNTQTQGYYSNASDYYNNHPNNNNYYTNNQYSG